ncbi:MAG: hypothetical protein QM504_10270 [Pseudomonadota bacterium]
MQHKTNSSALADPQGAMTLGDKLSMLYINDKSNKHGLLLSSHGQTSQCFVDGVVYSVRRQVDVESPLWRVLNTHNGASLDLKDDLAMGLINADDFRSLKRGLFRNNSIAF